MTRSLSRSGRVLIQSNRAAASLYEFSRRKPLSEGFAVTGRPAHIRVDEGDAEVVEVIIVRSLKDWPGLPLGTAMDVHNGGPLPREFRRRPVEPAGDRSSVESFPANQFRPGEIVDVDAAGFARRPALDLAGLDVG